jgi:6,7-dimethyl-8-ribityllumazine synthase
MAQSAHSPQLLHTGDLHFGDSPPHIAFVVTEWNSALVAEQLAGAYRILEAQQAIITEKITVAGAFEIPYGCRLALHSRPEVIIAFGAVIRGGTPHFEYVCEAVTSGITQFNLQERAPAVFGVLTLNTEAEAWERLGGIHGHKGEEAAITALKLVAEMRRVMPGF